MSTTFTLAKEKLDGEFLQGFETGILIRSDARAFKEFSCPTPESDNAMISQIQQIITPLKLAASMSKQEKMTTIIHQLETFVTALNDMTSVFTETYDGGDFCKGLIFGRDGANMLYEVA